MNLNINNEYSFDYEVIINEDETFSVPLKYTLDLLEINYEQNHYSKEIKFPENIIVDLKNQKIKYSEGFIDFRNKKNKLVFLKLGILENIQDEVFIPVLELDKILEDKITTNLDDYSISVETAKKLSISNNIEQIETKEYLSGGVKELNVVVPAGHPKFSVDSVGVNNSFQTDFIKENDLSSRTSDEFLNNTMQSTIKGRLLGGNYKIRTNIRNYNEEAFSFGGINANYEKEWDKYRLELGNISTLPIGETSIGDGVIGINFNNYVENKTRKTKLPDLVREDTDLNIYVNDQFYKTVSKEEAPDTLEFIEQNQKEINDESLVLKAKTEESSFLEPITLDSEESKFAVIAGVTGYEDRFFSNYPITNDLTSKKLVGGVKFERPLTSKLHFETVTVGDYIISTPSESDISSFLSQSIPSLVLSLSKDFRSRQGISQIFSLKHNTFDDFSLISDIGASLSDNRFSVDTQKINTFGYLARLKAGYEKPLYGLYTSVYDYSPDFYLAGSSDLVGSGSVVNDRRGFNVGGNLNLKYLTSRAEYNLYHSNLDDFVTGGDYNFNDYNFNFRVPVTRSGSLSFYRRAKIGENDSGEIESSFNRLVLSKRLTPKLSFDLRGLYNNFSTEFVDSSLSDSNFESKYSALLANVSYRLPKNTGKLSLIHENNRTKTLDFIRKVNAIRVGYTFPTFYNLSTTFTLGYRYRSLERDFDCSILFDYMFPSGRTLSFNYQYNQQSGIFLDDLFIPKSSRHSFLINLSDVFSLVEGGLKSNGYLNDDQGFIKVSAYLDTNRNGVFDKGEIYIPEIPINLVESKKTVYTNKKGKYFTKAMPAGFYNVKLDLNELPTLLSPSKLSNTGYWAKVEGQKTTKVNFGLISTVGNISGKLSVEDEFGREISIPDMVITINDEKGEEVNYTTVSVGETYYFTGLSPGEYKISLDKNFVEEYNLTPTQQERSVIIPAVYDEYIDIENFDLKYVQTFESL